MALLPVTDDRGTPSKMCAPMVKTEHLKMQDYFMQIYDSRRIIFFPIRQEYLKKNGWNIVLYKERFFFNVPNKAKGKKNTGGDAGRTLLTKVIAFSNLGDMYQIALFLMQWSSAEILLWLLSLPSFNFRLFWRSRQRGYVIGHLVNAEEWNCVQSY